MSASLNLAIESENNKHNFFADNLRILILI